MPTYADYDFSDSEPYFSDDDRPVRARRRTTAASPKPARQGIRASLKEKLARRFIADDCPIFPKQAALQRQRRQLSEFAASSGREHRHMSEFAPSSSRGRERFGLDDLPPLPPHGRMFVVEEYEDGSRDAYEASPYDIPPLSSRGPRSTRGYVESYSPEGSPCRGPSTRRARTQSTYGSYADGYNERRRADSYREMDWEFDGSGSFPFPGSGRGRAYVPGPDRGEYSYTAPKPSGTSYSYARPSSPPRSSYHSPPPRSSYNFSSYNPPPPPPPPPRSTKNHHATLKIPSNATEAQIRAAAKKRRIEVHPDRARQEAAKRGKKLTKKEEEEVERKAKEVGEAAEALFGGED